MFTKQTSYGLTSNTSLVLVLLSCLLFSRISPAIDDIQVSIEKIQLYTNQKLENKAAQLKEQSEPLFKTLNLGQLGILFDISKSPAQLSIDLKKLKLPEPYANFSSLKLTCNSLSLDNQQFSCTKANISLVGLVSKKVTTEAQFSLNYNVVTDKLILNIDNLKIFKGRISTQFKLEKNKWSTTIEAKNMKYQYLKDYFLHYLGDVANTIEDVGGRTSFSAYLSGLLSSPSLAKEQSGVQTIKFKGQFTNVRYLHGEDVADNLSFKLGFNVKKSKKIPENYHVMFKLDRPKGELYQNDIYLLFSGNERFETNFTYHSVKKRINFSSLRIFLPKIADFQSRGQLLLGNTKRGKAFDLRNLSASLSIKDFSQFNLLYLNNILEGTDYEGLKIDGAFKAKIEKKRQDIDLSSELNDLSLAFNEEYQQLSFNDLNGTFFWNNRQQHKTPVSESTLSWRQAKLNELPLGQTLFTFIAHNDRLTMTREAEIPLFDGALKINSLDIKHIGQTSDYLDTTGNQALGKQSMTVIIDGMIKPVSLGLLSEHFGWPLLDGTLSAVIPSTRYNEHYLKVGGAMMLQVFEGVVIVKDLTIEQPLLDSARLYANIDINNLNLKSLTKTYDFGEIEGRVEGKISQLVLQSWRPVAFDAFIRTPENDKSRHRISQRAIDNLSSLGGASGLLSRSFLSFFKTFGYNKIGLSCQLKNNVCAMSGVEKKGNSYYIVKGGGLPRIDVMGFQNQVNWQVLINRLKAIQSANQAVIQ